MVNFVATIFFIFCIVVIIIVLYIYFENKKMWPKKGQKFDDDGDDILFRP
jgi:p-aminobenzoyl-glutamate transporter AbgT